MQRLLALPKPYLIVLAVALIAAAAVAHSTVVAILAPGIDASFADKDFANYWMASRLLLAGKAQDLFGPWPVYFSHLQEAFGDRYPWHNWSYPPHFLLLIWPLGLFGYKTAMLVFLATTGALFLYACRAFIGERSAVAWIAVAPFMVLNFWSAQNGYLCAALALGALALRDRKPVIAGILLGVLTIKPQLGLLFPFLLLAERRWTVIASAAVSTFVLVATSAMIVGLDAWRGYFDDVLPYQTFFVMRNLTGAWLAMMPSVYGALRNWGIGSGPALTLHLMVAVPVTLILIVAFFRVTSGRDRESLLLIGTFITTPYALTYDFGLLVAGVGLLASKTASKRPGQWARTSIVALAMLLPLVMIPLGILKIPLATVIVFAIFFIALRDSGFMPAVFRRGEIFKTATAPSPAAASD